MNALLSQKTKRIFLSVLLGLTAIISLLLLFADTTRYGSAWSAALSGFSASGWIICVLTALGALVYLIMAVSGIISLLMGGKRYVTTMYGSLLIFLMLLICGLGQDVYESGTLLCVLILLLSSCGLVYHYLYRHYHKDDGEEDAGERLTDRERAGRLILTVTSAVSCLSVIALLFTPFVTYQSSPDRAVVPIEAASGATTPLRMAVFIGAMAAVLVSLAFMIRVIGRIGGLTDSVIRSSSALTYINLALTVIYYLSGYIYALAMYNKSPDLAAVGYPPILIAVAFALLYACVRGSFFPEVGRRADGIADRGRVWRGILIGFVAAFTVCTFLALFMNIVTAQYSVGSASKKVVINGMKLLRDYTEMRKEYRLLAFVILTALGLSVAFLLASLTALIGRSRAFDRIAVGAVTVNVLGTTALGVCGKYFEMVQAVNMQVLAELFDLSYVDPDSLGFVFKVKSDAYIPMLVSLGLLALLLLIAPFSRADKLQRQADAADASGQSADASAASEQTEAAAAVRESAPTEEPDSDPCPAFTELDEKAEAFERETAERRLSAFADGSLPAIVRFVVTYAANCRLHLTYREEEIADFIAGLGATRLTILQGMSGTGKTSLPKIAAEALMGNCEIIEVESSWRDKNELLGYYNEFSRTYTPRKFTQALYKAKLNPDVPTFIVLDEMNLSRIEYYFSDFLSLMENEEDKRSIKLLNVKLYRVADHQKTGYLGLSDGHTMFIPANVWFIGTANRDESTFAISDKVYDRAHTMNFRRRAVAESGGGAPLDPAFVPYSLLNDLFADAKSSFAFDVEKDDTVRDVERLLAPFNVSFGNRVARQIEAYVKVYCRCFRDPEARLSEALENVLLSEVVSKLENRTVENKTALAAEFDKLGLHRCGQFVLSLNEEFL